MARSFPYRITLLMYSGMRETYYIHASNHRDAFSKAHRFMNPERKDDGYQFINVDKLTKQYCADHHVTFSC